MILDRHHEKAGISTENSNHESAQPWYREDDSEALLFRVG